jgi:hypothetical protein
VKELLLQKRPRKATSTIGRTKLPSSLSSVPH